MSLELLMSRPAEYVSPNETVEDAARIMAEIDVGILPVVEEHIIVGMVSDRDIAIRAIGNGVGPETAVSDVMSRGIRCCSLHSSIEDALACMAENQVRRLPVIDGNDNLIGIISLSDLTEVASVKSSEALLEIAQPSAQHSQALTD